MLDDKNIVIIGGTSGMGLSAAHAFIRNGANIVAIGVDDNICQNARKELAPNAVVLQGDATREETAPRAIEACVENFGSFDGLYHVAGGSGRKMGDGPLHEVTLEGWNKTFELNLTSLMLSNRAAVRSFRDQNTGGTILNMGSVLGFSPSPKYFVTHAYAAAKAAIIGYSRSIASYYAKDNIRVNVIAPGLVETPMAQRAAQDAKIMKFIKTKQPLDSGRISQPKDLEGAACYFMSDQSRFTTGQVLAIDGGWSISEGQF
ncbi:MAG: SDR family oxidoreductase [Bacteroidetes bacterium]|jgi:NAD(P)-dependent dehydrogenase (short-subunit alcohol dehydrogenase family)|nr:SDR family oxidoreductase [Bacteroidota bacterium]